MSNRVLFLSGICFLILFLMALQQYYLSHQILEKCQVINPRDFCVSFPAVEKTIQKAIAGESITFWREEKYIHVGNSTERKALSDLFRLENIDSVYWNLEEAPSMELNRKLEITPRITIEWGVLNPISISENGIVCQIYMENSKKLNDRLTIYAMIPSEFVRKLEGLEF